MVHSAAPVCPRPVRRGGRGVILGVLVPICLMISNVRLAHGLDNIPLSAASLSTTLTAGGSLSKRSAAKIMSETLELADVLLPLGRKVVSGEGESTAARLSRQSRSLRRKAEKLVIWVALFENLCFWRRWHNKQGMRLGSSDENEASHAYKLSASGLTDNILRPGLPLSTYRRLRRFLKGSKEAPPSLSHQHCAVCLDSEDDSDLDDGASPEERGGGAGAGEVLLSLPCGHHYHDICVARWFHQDTHCPMCRAQVADLSERSVTLQVILKASKSLIGLGNLFSRLATAMVSPLVHLILPQGSTVTGLTLTSLLALASLFVASAR